MRRHRQTARWIEVFAYCEHCIKTEFELWFQMLHINFFQAILSTTCIVGISFCLKECMTVPLLSTDPLIVNKRNFSVCNTMTKMVQIIYNFTWADFIIRTYKKVRLAPAIVLELELTSKYHGIILALLYTCCLKVEQCLYHLMRD